MWDLPVEKLENVVFISTSKLQLTASQGSHSDKPNTDYDKIDVIYWQATHFVMMNKLTHDFEHCVS